MGGGWVENNITFAHVLLKSFYPLTKSEGYSFCVVRQSIPCARTFCLSVNMLSLHTPSTPGVGSKGHFFFFPKIGHVAYQIKLEEV